MPRTVSIFLNGPPLLLCPSANVLRRPRRASISRICCLTAAAGCATIALATTVLYSYESSRRIDAMIETRRLSATLGRVRELAEAQRRDAEGSLGETRQRLATLQAALATASPPPAPTPDTAPLRAALDKASHDLAVALAGNTRLTAEIDALHSESGNASASLLAQNVWLGERLAALRSANSDLQLQSDALQSQLLQIAAQVPASTSESLDPAAASDAPVPETRWALGVSYDTAKGFGTLCFDRNSVREAPPAADAFRRTSATRAESAATFRFTHDRAHDRVFSAALSVSLAADGPRDRLTENTKLTALFLQTFAPALRNPDEWLNAVARQLAGKDAAQRAVLIDTTYKITAWNDGHNTFTFKVESPRADLDD